MRLTIRAMTDPPSYQPWMSDPVEVCIPSDTSLADVFRAAPIGKVEPPIFNDWDGWEPWLRKPDGEWFPDFGVPWAVTDAGYLVWDPPSSGLTVGELVRSVDEGILDADLSCIHFWAVEGLGANGPELLAYWPAFEYWLGLLADGITVAGCVAGLYVLVRNKWRTWKSRGAEPGTMVDFVLSRKERGIDCDQLATLLSTEKSEACALLVALGFVETREVTGLFAFDPDDAAGDLLRRIEEARGEACEALLPPDVVDRLLDEHGYPCQDDE